MIDKVKKVIGSPSFIYVFLRYVTYALAFVNALLLAKYLGEYNYGIYSFILLIMSYMSYTSFGINDSLNTEYASKKDTLDVAQSIWNNAWSLNIVISLIIAIFCVLILILDRYLFTSFLFNDYKYPLLFICLVTSLSRIYITYYRLNGKLFKLNLQQILPNFSLFIAALILKNRLSIDVIVYILLITNLISLVAFRINLPNKPSFSIQKEISIILLRRGISLLLYNLSFYLMTLLASTVVSRCFSVSIFGCYSFSNSLVNGVIMAGGAFLFIFYPKILNRMNRDDEKIKMEIRNLKSIYVVAMDVICLLSIVIIIYLSKWYPQYGEEMVKIYSILILGKCVNNATTGYSALLISRGKELKLAFYGFTSVGIVGILAIFFQTLGLSVVYMALAVTFASVIYTALVLYEGISVLYGACKLKEFMKEFFGNKSWLLYFIILYFSFVSSTLICIFVGFVGYIVFNYNNIKTAIRNGLKIISDEKALSF